MKEFLAIVVLGAIIAVTLCWWLGASNECAARHGVLVRNAWGFPACVAGAP